MHQDTWLKGLVKAETSIAEEKKQITEQIENKLFRSLVVEMVIEHNKRYYLNQNYWEKQIIISAFGLQISSKHTVVFFVCYLEFK